jgi:hypothetical protein
VFQDVSLVKAYGIRPQTTPFYHPQANPVERSNKNIKQLISAYLKANHKAWDEYLREFQFALNSVQEEYTKFSPTYLNFGRESPAPNTVRSSVDPGAEPALVDHGRWSKRVGKLKELYNLVKDHLTMASSSQRSRYNLRRRPLQTKPEDRVLRRTHHLSSAVAGTSAKLFPWYEGPYVVERISPAEVCQLIDDRGKPAGTWHVSQLKPYIT